jgi:5'(3')-deoxyribonucleotidase
MEQLREHLRLGIDLDGVVADFNVGWMERYNREFGAQLHHSQVVMWDGLQGLTHFPTMDAFWEWARSGPASIFRDLPIFAGARETMERLANDHRVVIVSSKFDWAIPDTLAWLADHRIPAREIHFVWDKTSVPCDVYLEDAPHNLAALVARRSAALVCRMVRPWNRPLAGARDVADWPEFEAAVEEWLAAGGHPTGEERSADLPRDTARGA